MDDHPWYPMTESQLHRSQDMLVEGVYSAESQEAHHVERAAGLLDVIAQLRQRRKLEELTASDAQGNPDNVLGDHPAGPQVQVADLTVAHLTFGQAHGELAGGQEGAETAVEQLMPDGGIRELDGVSLTFFPIAPAVEHNQ